MIISPTMLNEARDETDTNKQKSHSQTSDFFHYYGAETTCLADEQKIMPKLIR